MRRNRRLKGRSDEGGGGGAIAHSSCGRMLIRSACRFESLAGMSIDDFYVGRLRAEGDAEALVER